MLLDPTRGALAKRHGRGGRGRRAASLTRRRLSAAGWALYLTLVAWGVFGPSPGEEVNEASARIRAAQRDIWRSPSVRDVRWTTTGAAVGFALWIVATAAVTVVRHRRARAAAP